MVFQCTDDPKWKLIEAKASMRCSKDLILCTYRKLLMSNLLNPLSPFSWYSVMSILGIGSTSLMTLSFSGLKLSQIWTDPYGLGTTTIAELHGVGSVT